MQNKAVRGIRIKGEAGRLLQEHLEQAVENAPLLRCDRHALLRPANTLVQGFHSGAN